MNPKIKVALASFGMSGQVFHGPSLKVNSGFEVVKILERSKELSKSLFPKAEIVRNYNEILDDGSIELVVVNTPDRLHYEMSKLALEAGKHVVVEKPVTFHSEEATELIELAKNKNLIITVYQNRRWDGDFRTVRKVIENKILGRLVEFESHFDRYRNYVAPNTWKEEGHEYTGVLYNLGSHMVDQALVLFGMPKSVTAYLGIVRTGGKVNDYYDIRLQYDNFAALLKCSYLAREPGARYTVHGTLGSFHKYGIDPQEQLLKKGNLPVGDGWGTEPDSEWGWLNTEQDGLHFNGQIETIPGDYNIFYNNVYDAIRNDAELLVKPEESRDGIKILEACLKSNRERITVDLA